MSDYWEYLDNFDKNLLYLYSRSLLQEKNKFFGTFQSFCGEKSEYAEKKKKIGFYLIWVVFRYVLKCETYQEAIKYATKENLKKYNLNTILHQRVLYIGIYGLEEIYLYKEEDINIALEIVYERLGLVKQLECYIKHSTNTLRKTRKKCIEIKERYLKIKERREKEDEENNNCINTDY